MAKKRASLKGKGIDVLFGGPAKPADESQNAAPTPVEESQESVATSKPKIAKAPAVDANDLSGLLEETPVATPSTPAAAPALPAAPPLPESLPVNEADDDEADVTLSEDVVDDLGLPVAMEAPPPDLELAMPVAEQPAVAPAIEAAPPIAPHR